MSATDTDIDTTDETIDDRTTIRTGRDFEREYRLNAVEAGDFLVALGERLREGDDLKIIADDWKLPFRVGGPVELEIDFEGVGDPELEIEIEIPGRTDETAPTVE
jgi:amphi-Trp domain-containing protein